MEGKIVFSFKNNLLANIKSNYILKKIFNYMKEKIILRIILYNNKIKKRINKNINDYKKIYSEIKIEFTIYENLKEEDNGKDEDEGDISHFHIKIPEDIEKMKKNYSSIKEYPKKYIKI